ncbi:MAG: hypothetical protein ACREVX_07910 [Clostridium sp.]|uniref:hypothetical protein n=1 Tax=Clostridium sp. TaxID=1506 RepID=UPI003D6D6913
MAIMYFAKFNVNSKVPDVRRGKTTFDKILDELFKKIDDNTTYNYRAYNNVKQDDNTYEKVMYIDDRYIFSELEKNYEEKYIMGKLIRRYNIHGEAYDEESKKSIKTTHENSSSILFFFDIRKEIIAFCTRGNFGYNQFNRAIKGLAEEYLPEMEFEVYLQKNIYSIEDELKKFKRINKISANIIPPNSNGNDLEALERRDVEKLGQAGVTKKQVSYYASSKNDYGIDTEADFIQSTFLQCSIGYGDFVTEGINHKNEKYVFKSNEGALLERVIKDEEKDDTKIFKERAVIFITQIRSAIVLALKRE